MCTWNNKRQRRWVKDEMGGKKGRRTFWKRYAFCKNKNGRGYRLMSWWKYSNVFGPGVMDSGRKTIRATRDRVCKAIHVFRDKPVDYIYGNSVIVPVRCEPGDLITADADAAAFRKVRLTHRAWRQAMRDIRDKLT